MARTADAELLPDHHLHLLISYLELFHNDTRDFRSPHVRRALLQAYPLVVALYALLGLTGAAANVCFLAAILRRRLLHEPTVYFLSSLAASGLLQCVAVLPPTLANLLILNWRFGRPLCFLLPVLQSAPVHASTLTFLALAVDRYRLVLHPLSGRVPKRLCALAAWVLALCVVTPFAIYVKYFDLGALLGPSLEGMGLCVVNAEDDMEEYLRGLFIVMYVLPLAVVAFLHVRIAEEIKALERPPGMAMADDGFDPAKEKRTQKHLGAMVALFGACVCPLEIMKLVKDIVPETKDNTGRFDLAYVIVVWIGFLPTCSTPLIAAAWMMSEPAKQRLWGYFRLSGRRVDRAMEKVLESQEGKEPNELQPAAMG